MGFVEEARAARAAAEGARAAYRGRVARAERSFLEARETRAESERSLEDALGSALLIARFKSLRLYPDRIECKGEAIRLGEVLGIDAEMEGSILQKVSVDPNSWSKSIRTIDKRTAVVTVRTPEWEYSVRTGPGQEASARRFVEAARDVLADPGRYREWRDARIAGMPGALARADAARAAEAAAWSALAAARADTRAVGDAEAQLAALMARASPDDLSLLAEADREGARRASAGKAALAVGLALLGALLAFALFAALSAAISALAGSPFTDGLRRSMAEAVARAV